MLATRWLQFRSSWRNGRSSTETPTPPATISTKPSMMPIPQVRVRKLSRVSVSDLDLPFTSSPMCFFVPAVVALSETLPQLMKKLDRLQNTSFQPSNISDSIQRIRQLIEQARNAANKVQLFRSLKVSQFFPSAAGSDSTLCSSGDRVDAV